MNTSFWMRTLASFSTTVGGLLANLNGSKRQAAQIQDVTGKVDAGLEAGAALSEEAEAIDAAIAAEKAQHNQQHQP